MAGCSGRHSSFSSFTDTDIHGWAYGDTLTFYPTGLTPFITDTLTYGETMHGKDYNIALISKRNHLKAPIYVGDTEGDCRSAHSAGCPMLHVTYGFGTAPDADYSAGSFDEVVSFFNN